MRVLKALGKFFHRLFVIGIVFGSVLGFGLVVACVAVLLQTQLEFPNLVVSDRMLRIGSHLLFSEVFPSNQVLITRWDDLKINIESQSFFQKRIQVRSKDLCFIYGEDQLKGCVAHLQGAVHFNLRNLKFQIQDLKQLRMDDLRWSLQDQAAAYHGTLHVLAHLDRLGLPPEARVWGQVVLPGGQVARLDASAQIALDQQSGTFLLRSQLERIRTRQTSAEVVVKGSVEKSLFKGSIQGKSVKLFPWLSKLQLHGCQFQVQKKQAFELGLQCPFVAQLQFAHWIPTLKNRIIQVPEHYQGSVELQAVVRSNGQFPDLTQVPKGRFQLHAEAMQASVVKAHLKWEGDVSALESSQFQVHLATPQFQAQSNPLLMALGFEIPAPFSQLQGPLNLGVTGDVRGILQKVNHGFSVKLTTQLASSTQKLHAEGQGTLQWVQGENNEISPKIQATVKLVDVQLDLPHLGLSKPPRLVPDPRILGGSLQPLEDLAEGSQSTATSLGPVRYQLHIYNAGSKNHPILLNTNLSKVAVPVSLDLTLSDSEPLAGRVQLDQWPLELFRREAVVREFDVQLRAPIQQSLVSGRIDVDYSDYQISLLLHSTLEHPQVRFLSDPPLSENQTLAALLFGQPLKDLDPDQLSSVSDSRAAFKGGALSLASMYVFAATPIEQVGYDEKSGQVLVKFRLGDRTSLNLGSSPGGSTNTIGIQKRLLKHWRFTTEFKRIGDGGSNVGRGYVEWNHRY